MLFDVGIYQYMTVWVSFTLIHWNLVEDILCILETCIFPLIVHVFHIIKVVKIGILRRIVGGKWNRRS